MSVAFYPRLGLFTFGSESSATKAGLGKSVPGSADAANEALFGPEFLDGLRFDLDDVNGEVVLLRWGKDSTAHELDASKHKLKEELTKEGKKGVDDVPPLELTPHALKAKAYMAQVMPITNPYPNHNPEPNPNPNPTLNPAPTQTQPQP